MADDKNVASELDALQGMYESTAAKVFAAIDDGNYISTITDLKIKKTPTGKIQAQIKHTIVDNEKYEGKSQMQFFTIDNEEGFAYFKGFCQVVGMDMPAKMADLQAAANDFVAAFNGKLKITIKEGKSKDGTPSGFKNVYVNGFHEAPVTA
jgi:hypothetical protein